MQDTFTFAHAIATHLPASIRQRPLLQQTRRKSSCRAAFPRNLALSAAEQDCASPACTTKPSLLLIAGTALPRLSCCKCHNSAGRSPYFHTASSHAPLLHKAAEARLSTSPARLRQQDSGQEMLKGWLAVLDLQTSGLYFHGLLAGQALSLQPSLLAWDQLALHAHHSVTREKSAEFLFQQH